MSVLGGGPGAAQAIPYFEQATQIDPSYAAAWAMLGFAIGTTSWNAERGAAVELHDRAYRNLLRATELDPESATAQSILGTFGWIRSDWVGGEQAHARAVALAPSSDGFINNQYGNLLARAGRNSEARAQFVAASRADPLLINNWLPQTYLAQGRFAEAGQEIDRLAALGYGEPGITALRLHVALSAHDSAEVKLRIAEFVAQSPASSAFYAAILADFDSPETVRSTLRDFSNDDRRHWPDKAQDIALLAAYVGDPELALQVMSAELRSLRLRIFTLWHPVMAEARKLPEFKTVVTDLGLVEYWRMYGWPDACRPVGETDFECS
jgi:tetratricopeptide (TPR) repeat protein